MGISCDFSGYATRNDMRCSDGLTIRHGAFNDCDGETVPLVWSHQHGSPTNVLGKCILENRPDGVYAYGLFNNTDAGRDAKELVQHEDVNALSIYANCIRKSGNDVVHGVIREVSLVLAGANPGAYIDEIVAHGDVDGDSGEAIIYGDDFLQVGVEKMEHAEKTDKEEPMADKKEKTVQDVLDSMNEDQKNVLAYLVGKAL